MLGHDVLGNRALGELPVTVVPPIPPVPGGGGSPGGGGAIFQGHAQYDTYRRYREDLIRDGVDDEEFIIFMFWYAMAKGMIR